MRFRLCRIVLISLLMLCAGVLLCACDGTGGSGDTDVDAPPLRILGEGAPAYTVVRGDNAESGDIDAMILFNKYLKACGASLSATTDWEQNPVSEYEIVIGETLRDDTDPTMTLDAHDMGPQGWFVKAAGNRIYLCGGTPQTTLSAVEYFLSVFFGYTGDPEIPAVLDTVEIPANYEHLHKQDFALSEITVNGADLRGYRIVWDAQLTNMKGPTIAQQLQDTLYSTCGIWVPIDAKNAGTSPVIFLEYVADGSFSVAERGGNLVIGVDDSSFARGFRKFSDAYLADKEGLWNIEQNFSFHADTGSYVLYSEFGAVGDGITDDLAAIIETHEYANRYGIPVKADEGAVYYIAAVDTAVIRTDTDWTGASFIIDDREVPLDKRYSVVFDIVADKAGYSITDDITPPKKGQENLGIPLPEKSIVILTDDSTRRYIREGVNANSGSDQTDILVVDTDGTIDPLSPILWDYTQLSSVSVIPIDAEPITVRGGSFTTIVADNIADPTYYNRGIRVRRSNVTVEGIRHYVENETAEIGAPYGGILLISDAAYVTVRDCLFTPHFTFRYKLEDGSDFTQGTYDILPTRSVHLTLENCSQTVDITDDRYWGIIGSNFCKNIVVDGCSFSRVDAHQGVANLTVRNSELGYQCLSVIGSGELLVEGCTLYGYHLITLRSDYGSHWDGNLTIRDCTWIPNWGKEFSEAATIISGSYSGFHNFGFECCMPKTIVIDGLYVDDTKAIGSYNGMYVFSNITKEHTSQTYEDNVAASGYPYRITETLTVRNFSCASGKKWRLSSNAFMFRNVEIIEE